MQEGIENIRLGAEAMERELKERNAIMEDSSKILKRVFRDNPREYEQEVKYQTYRNKFSNAYFSGSEFYRGPCLTDYLLDKPVEEDQFMALLLSSVLKSFKQKLDI